MTRMTELINEIWKEMSTRTQEEFIDWIKIPEVDKRMRSKFRRAQYEKYMLSDRWRAKRIAKLEAVGWKCERCGYSVDTRIVEIPIDVHHKTYERFGDERLDDLEVLCRHCHQAHHGRVF